MMTNPNDFRLTTHTGAPLTQPPSAWLSAYLAENGHPTTSAGWYTLYIAAAKAGEPKAQNWAHRYYCAHLGRR